MTITYKKGDLFTTKAKYILHGCNCQGKMGSGVAKQIRELFPAAYDMYKEKSELKELHLGDVHQICHYGQTIYNCMTQEYYGYGGKLYTDYGAVRQCLHEVSALANDGLKIAMPKIGCGLGGGDWDIVEKIIEEELISFEVEVWEL